MVRSQLAPVKLLPSRGGMKMRILGLAAAVALCLTTVSAEKLAKPGADPVEAELMADLHARLLKVGETVYARVKVEWRSPSCDLKNGAVLEAHVVSVVPSIKPVKASEVGLAFTRAQCGNMKMGPFNLVLSAVAAPPENSDLGLLSYSLPVQAMSGIKGSIILNSMRISNDSTLNTASPEIYLEPLIPRMEMGDVYHVRGLKLSVGTGPENSSILTSKDHDVSLEKHSLLMLIPARWTVSEPSGEAVTIQPESNEPGARIPAVARVAAMPPSPPVNDIDLCVPPQCNVALPSGNANEAGHAAASISIRELGYSPRPQRDAFDFIHDEVLAYLGPRELLVCFNPHELVSRDTKMADATVRIIRAAVVDTETHRVTHTVDWEMFDRRQYLWPLADGRVLVHVGSELRVYGEGLQIQNRVPLDGSLAFVRVTPDGGFMAVGVLHERHTPELHAQLRENLNGDPEEDVNILVLNRNFETVAKSTVQSNLMPPTLLNEGQVTLSAQPNMRYRISMLTWDNHASVVARFTSNCTPELSSIAPDLIFLVSCDKQNGGREYRVLRANGKLVLKGDSTLNDCGHAAEGSANQQAFVVKIVQSALPVPPGAPMSASQFSTEELRVYRAGDSKRLLSVHAGPPSLSRDGYALAPDASQLAVLTRNQLEVYSVPAK
jgi:hypothetical protein